MASKKLRTLAIVGFAALVGLVGFGAFAAGGGHGHFGGHCAGGGPMGAHGPLGMHFQMMKLIDDLDLTADQKTHVEAIHQILAERWDERHEQHGEHARLLIDRLEQGPITSEEVRPVIDQHIEQFRGVAYSISEELVALVNSLDDSQRATLRAHVEAMHGDDAASAEP